MSLKNKITLTVVIVFMIVVSVIGLTYLSVIRSDLDIQANKLAAEQCFESANVLTNYFNVRFVTVNSAARELYKMVRNDSAEKRIPSLQYALGLTGFEYYAFKWNNSWYKVKRTESVQKVPEQDLSAFSSKVVYGRLYRDEQDGLLFVRRVEGEYRNEIGMLTAKLSAQTLWDDIASTESLKDVKLVLSKPTGEIIFPAEMAGGQLFVGKLNEINPIIIQTNSGKIETRGMTMTMRNAALNVTAFVNDDITRARYEKVVLYFLAAALLGEMLICVVVYLAVSKMSRSITDLADYVTQMGTDLDSIPERFTKRSDEAGTLSRSFGMLFMRLKTALEKQEYMACHDSLTHLRNRYCLEHMVAELIEENKPFAFGLLDIDDFKMINDARGHDEGDRQLKRLANLLKGFNPCELMSYRWGGDEFALTIFGDSFEAYNAVLEKLMKRVAEELIDENGRITVSIGVCMYPEFASNYKELLIAADKALAWAKMSGKVNFCFYSR